MVDFVGDRAASRFIKSFCQTSLKQMIDVHRQRFASVGSVRDADVADVESPSKVSVYILPAVKQNVKRRLGMVFKWCW